MFLTEAAMSNPVMPRWRRKSTTCQACRYAKQTDAHACITWLADDKIRRHKQAGRPDMAKLRSKKLSARQGGRRHMEGGRP